ncbi:DUF4041 domain-containing protein [Leucobacter weissii]|uniref:DUF4041 domain-containing protein n=1 Tax=Leucobacter weissii TaxID=1983706 RepID=A0A939SBF4_9MICO|nr:DUF4041 domain-containing protein [Leucobacter weissii]MBO1901390.1 DUF4041 domain-containing protein [Leucobacter weissii]
MSNDVPAGWYPHPDPARSDTVRWWDGSNWSTLEHTDFSGVDVNRLSKREARATISQLQDTIRSLEDVINRHGLREYEDFTTWRQERLDGLNKYHADVAEEVSRRQSEKASLIEKITELKRDVVALSSTRDFQDVGYFEFEHPAEASTTLATELEHVRSRIKDMIRDKSAADYNYSFTFNNSTAQGKRFVNALTRLMLRAYNAEAENAIKATKAGNLQTAQARLSRAADQIAKNGQMIDLRISPEFHRLRLKEIELAHRHMKALQQEKDLERERRAELREQRKAEQELKREQERLEKEKAHYQATLIALRAKGDEEGVARMLAKLEDVERAIVDVDYRVANIRAGYVYVISNVGSFGPKVVKIGMTRRLDPMDRVRELGDASVPFRFDVHALFFADDAVAIENMLHKEFSHVRINQVNMRREYFETTPDAVLDVLKKHAVEVLEFRVEAPAEEYIESIARRTALLPEQPARHAERA